MWIKVCANTNLEDARLAADLGADAVGFVFAASSRQVTPTAVGCITPHLPAAVERIGVFDSHDAAQIVRTVEQAGLTGVQLHGSLDIDLIEQLVDTFGDRISIIQVLHWDISPNAPSPSEALVEQLRWLDVHPSVQRVLVDSRIGGASGGTGLSFDWNAAAETLRAELGDRRLIVAGGLRTENVAEAIQRLHPWGVDVATGVERSPGRKDPEKLEAFLRKASRSFSPA